MKFKTDDDLSIETKMRRRERYGVYSDFAADPFSYFEMYPKYSFLPGFILAAATLFFIYVILQNTDLYANLFSTESVFLITIFVFFLPFIYFEEKYQKKIEIIEEQMPGFFRDLANLISGGLTLSESLTEFSGRCYYENSEQKSRNQNANENKNHNKNKKNTKTNKNNNKTRHNSFFFEEIQLIGLKMKSGQTFDSCLENFGKRYDSKLVQRAASVISAAEKSGGLMYLSIDAAAFDLQEAVNLKKERDSNQAVYGTVLFISFLLFIGIVILLIQQFESMTLLSSQATPSVIINDAAVMLYHMLFIQAFFSGLMIGKLRKGKTAAGLKYSFLMIFAVWISFMASGIFAVG